MSTQNGRAQWATNMGFILAAAGSAVGLGNIWKFPGKAYEGGGAAFILIYLAIVAIIGTTVMLAEFVIGRHTQKDTIGAYSQLRSSWKGWGFLGVVTAFIILSYYFQVGGWVVYYIYSYIFKSAEVMANPLFYFYNLLGYDAANSATFFPLAGAIICPLIFIGLTVFIVVRGVEKGIERFNKIGMPALFGILIILMIRAVTLPGASEGVKYMLTPDFSKVTGETFLIALGQAFFSLSLGMSIMITYGSYLKRDENLAKNTVLVCGFDTLIAFMAAFMIVPAVFATLGSEGVGKGGGFAFVALAGVFQNMPAGVFFGILFYLLLFFAAMTSAISLLEGAVAAVSEQRNWDRKKVTIGMALAMFIVGVFYTISQASVNLKGVWFDFTDGVSFPALADFMENVTDRLLIPICALTACLLAGWVWGAKNGVEEVRQGGKFPFSLGNAWSVSVKFIAPVAIIIIIIFGLFLGKAIS
ncbi:MAG: sodium-dependent transporter [Treponema sp.]|jgi:NSS family neurotransmitter:Na+ symporter|nr:sodium-dependent transporter [Treponema sp.]